ncbi:aspartate kinase [Bisgaardia hudsonensis]|uniref:Aspartokinase n=1 Tax=Bisgaardia hudsonensis TaxID=109472 RepID=A0A4R2N2W8_9PAST|nr:lysine-sensitive aspartokinase 3 [Bisgaardia hudsonensis]QLB12623.1 lysine-sensitive aspartokinase 3 [Bisgaardia hudsonensis]TCP14165.1 aspartate kinase [Bisgaardia hudsonensis]
MSALSVAKFGGTSVADYEAMQSCAKIIISDPNTRVVVLSASAGVTNLLVELARGCDIEKQKQLISEITKIQEAILIKLKDSSKIKLKIDLILKTIENLSEAANLATSPALTDELISQGEMMSTLIFVQLLAELNIKATWIDVRTIITTDSQFGKAVPNDEVTQKNSDLILKPLINEGELIITQGFIGRNSEGKTTTLGRGGSDYSAALLAEVLNAKNVLIWTDVAGIYTTDPRIVKNAKKIDTISFSEAAEMATFGAKVLHPATLLPAVRSNIPVYVGSSKSPEEGGTWVISDPQPRPTFRAIALRREQTLLTLTSLSMLHAQGFIAHIFSILAKHKISVDTITTSEVSVALTLDLKGSTSSKTELLSPELLLELEKVANVNIDTGLALVALVGNNLHTSIGIAKQIFNAIDQYNVRMISYGASPNNVCTLVSSGEADDIVRILHKKLFE